MNYISYLRDQAGRAIYVRGAQGENLLAMTNAKGWITAQETYRRSDYMQHKEEYDRNAERAIALYEQRKAAGISPLRAFDCSGLTMYYAQNLTEIVNKDYNTSGIYKTLCTKKISGAPTIRGQLVFRSSDGTPSGINHMATYVGDGQIIESRGRDYGVISRAYKASDWTFTGEWPDLMRECAEPHMITVADEPAAIRRLQEALNALGFTDEDYHTLKCDGVFGDKTAAALEQLIRYNIPELKLIVTRKGPVWASAEKI